jgi:LIVCS family branched-chain amino acid:cation transporter
MKKFLQSNIVSTGLAIFSMLFGAGNLMYPLAVGITSGDKNIYGITGFIMTAVLLPVAGFIGMMLFNGNYNTFFNRLGRRTGAFTIAVCMIIIGPLIVIPRLTTLSHIMIAPFIPLATLSAINPFSLFLFSLLFLGITFLLTYKENNIVDILGLIISPLLLASLIIIIIKGIATAEVAIVSNATPLEIFRDNLLLGYQTLDLLGAIFFSSIVITLLKNKMGKSIQNNPKTLAIIGLKSGLVGATLLGIVYVGMSLLGVYHGHGFESANAGKLFQIIALNIMGSHGAIVIATAVLMACFSTSIALSAVVAEYVHSELCMKRISYASSLAIVLILCVPMSTAGLDIVIRYTVGMLTFVGYPVLITLTFCNILYKLFGFKPVKIPVFLTFILTLAKYKSII